MRQLAILLALCGALAGQPQPLPTIAAKTAAMQRNSGLFPFFLEERTGKIWLQVDRWNREFLYVNSLPAGVGSNDLGLDRGRLGETRIVRFERAGPKVLLIEGNYGFRALSQDADEHRAVRESFAESVVWGFAVEAEENGSVLVDATPFFLRDAVDVTGVLRRARQGSYTLDATRCALYAPRTKNFEKNTEVEAILTFTGQPEGRFVREAAADARAITVRQHHSLVELPEPGYQPLAYDPRAGYFGVSFMDYAAPVGEPVRKRYLARHRPGKVITYYLDRGAPEPIRSALLEGARWWQQAFDAAGLTGRYRVELMPEGADPMDLRYNVIQWVHRSTRGWSYGSTVMDPRTGEILKGHVTLGSLRVRQDYLIAEGLLAPYEDGKPVPPAMLEMALARLRQLSAHEVGHTLGLSHNYAASPHNRASVMDYPHPLVRLDSAGSVDLSEAYAAGIGEWDKVAIAFGYGGGGTAVLDAAHKRGLYFLSDEDARPEGSAHPYAHLWDNGADPARELLRLLDVRERALARFSANNIPPGRPMSTLEEPLVTTYLLHRYQTEAAAKMLGGLDYTYALRGDGQRITRIVDADAQRRALDAVLRTILPETLTLPERILTLLPPAAQGFERTAEYFPTRTGLTFDPLSAAESAAGHTVRLLLHPERAARLIQYHARDARNPGLQEVMDRLIAATWKRRASTGLAEQVGRTVDHVALDRLMALAADPSAPPQVRAIAHWNLEQLRVWLRQAPAPDSGRRAHFAYAASRIVRFFEEAKPAAPPKPLDPPPGQPIGGW